MLSETVVGIRASPGSCSQVERMADCGDGVGSRNNGNGTQLRNNEHPEGGSQGPGSPHMPGMQAVPDGVDADAARPDDDYEEDSVEFKLGAIYQLIEGKRLCFAVHRDDEETLRDIKRFPRLFFFSSDLQVAVTRPPCTSPHHGLASRHILGLILVEPGHDGPQGSWTRCHLPCADRCCPPPASARAGARDCMSRGVATILRPKWGLGEPNVRLRSFLLVGVWRCTLERPPSALPPHSCAVSQCSGTRLVIGLTSRLTAWLVPQRKGFGSEAL